MTSQPNAAVASPNLCCCNKKHEVEMSLQQGITNSQHRNGDSSKKKKKKKKHIRHIYRLCFLVIVFQREGNQPYAFAAHTENCQWVIEKILNSAFWWSNKLQKNFYVKSQKLCKCFRYRGKEVLRVSDSAKCLGFQIILRRLSLHSGRSSVYRCREEPKS